MLLEIVLALGLFVATAMTLLGVVSGAIDSLNRSRDRLIGADHARNALAMIEAGIARPETLNGPVAPWSAGEVAGQLSTGLDAGSGFDPGFGPGDAIPAAGNRFTGNDPPGAGRPDTGFTDLDAEPTGWALQIETEPARIPGLTLVVVRAHRVDDAGDELPGGAAVTLRQIIALGADAGEVSGEFISAETEPFTEGRMAGGGGG